MPTPDGYQSVPCTDPGDPYAGQPDRTPLTDETGRLALVFSRSESVPDGTPWADAMWVPAGVSTAATATLVGQAMAGWLLSTTDGELAATLTAAGAAERRHAFVLTHDLGCVPSTRQPPDSTPLPAETVQPLSAFQPLSAVQLARHADRLGAVHARAYPAGHPDARAGGAGAASAHLRAIAGGEVLGPLYDAVSSVAIAAGSIVGACLVVDRDGTPPHGGPWILDVFRDPVPPARGIGRALLERSLQAAAEAGLPALSLAVSAGNETARRLYSRLGFRQVEESWTLALP